MREKSQGSCSVDDSNVFDGGLDDSDCRNTLYNCLETFETRVTEIFGLGNTTNENQIKGARKLENLTDAVDFIKKKFEDYEAFRRQKDKVIKSLRGQFLALHNNLENLEVNLVKQGQCLPRNCLLIYGISANKDEDTDDLVIKTLKSDMNIGMKIEQIEWTRI